MRWSIPGAHERPGIPSPSCGSLCRLAVFGVRQPVRVEQAVEVVELVLEDAREPPLGPDLERRSVQVDGAQDGARQSGAAAKRSPGNERQPSDSVSSSRSPTGGGLIQSSGLIATPRCCTSSSSIQL